MGKAPVRRCLACRRAVAKPNLVRLAVAGGNVIVDPRARQPGRGAYVCGDSDCLEVALRKDGAALARALRFQRGQVTVDGKDIRRQWSTAAGPATEQSVADATSRST